MKRTHKILGVLFLSILSLLSLIGAAGCAPQTPLRVLISNDDGVDAPGIAALADALLRAGRVTVAAPAENHSGASHSITFGSPVAVKTKDRKGVTWYAIEAKPATCVRMALEALLPEKPDLVVSGINKGANLGVVTFYSATVGCAREAAFKNIPTLAVSLESGAEMDYGLAADFVVRLVEALRKQDGLRPGLFLNINIPALPRDRIKGVRVTRQDLRPSHETYEKRSGTQEEGFVYWPSFRELEPGPENTDVWAIRNGYISITPMHFDQTVSAALEPLAFLQDIGWR